MRSAICTALCAATLSLATAAVAQQYPDRPIRLIVPFAPGGTTDILARILGQRLGENLGQQIIIDSRGGAGGNLGTALAARAPADGYTLLLGVISPLAINVSLYGAKLPYSPVRDFAPVSLITKVPQVISLHPSVPARTVKELIALGKAHPGKLTFGSAGLGTSNHLVGELLNVITGIRMVHVPYKSAGLASVAVFSGEVDMMISAPPAVMQFFKAGRMRALAVTSAMRSPALPEVPTMMESGFPDFEATAWYCMMAPAGTPRPVIDKVHAALVKSLDAPQVRQRLLDEGAAPESSTPEELGAFIRAEIDKWEKVVKRSGVRLD
jgi:tripartite-type tricarboxylate transporter receptor subunit TctC